MKKKSFYFFTGCFLLLFFITGELKGQELISGIVIDSVTNKPVPFVSITFDDDKAGGISNSKGEFYVEDRKNSSILNFSNIGYRTKQLVLEKNRTRPYRVLLVPEDYQVGEVVIRSGKEKYSKKNNPAVELIQKVIAHKNTNRIESNDYYQFEQYEKIALGITNITPEMKENRFYRKLQFVFDYLDTSAISNTPVLTFSVREKLSDEYRRREPEDQTSIVRGIRHRGVEKEMEAEMEVFWNEAMKDIDIFDNEIEILLKKLVSPLTSVGAVSFYKYYIVDTVLYKGDSCVNLAFVPFNNRDLGFTGNLLVDSTYSVRRVELRTPNKINLNFIGQMHIMQEFDRLPTGKWAKSEETSTIEFSLFEKLHGLYAQNTRSYKNYVINQTSDLVFGFSDQVIKIRNAEEFPDSVWQQFRPVPLRRNEQNVDSLIANLHQVSYYKYLMTAARILISNYIHTASTKDRSQFDIGPVASLLSYNDIQGLRVRLGGRTTANFNDRLFFKGYGAYGIKDKKMMYSGSAVYSFYKKQYHEKEYRRNNLTFLYQYDIHTPGETYAYTAPDHFLLSFKRGKPADMAYLRQLEVSYEKEFSNGFSWNIWNKLREETTAGELHYYKPGKDGTNISVDKYKIGELGFTLRLAKNEAFYQGKDKRHSLKSEGPVFSLTQRFGLKGYLGGEYNYTATELYAQKEIWLFGYGSLNLIGKAGQIWGKVPYPQLLLPNVNRTYTIQPESYSLMNPMEFINDRYVAADIVYRAEGLLFNRIPFLQQFGWREVVSFKGLLGDLSRKNKPTEDNNLFLFPEETYSMNKMPYMEFSAGIENILKFFRVDYVRRITYLNHPDISKHGIRLNVVFSF